MIHHYNHETLVVLVLFTVSFYHFLFSRYLELAERHFSSDILVPFPDSGVLYSRDRTTEQPLRNVSAPIQFRRNSQPQNPKRLFS